MVKNPPKNHPSTNKTNENTPSSSSNPSSTTAFTFDTPIPLDISPIPPPKASQTTTATMSNDSITARQQATLRETSDALAFLQAENARLMASGSSGLGHTPTPTSVSRAPMLPGLRLGNSGLIVWDSDSGSDSSGPAHDGFTPTDSRSVRPQIAYHANREFHAASPKVVSPETSDFKAYPRFQAPFPTFGTVPSSTETSKPIPPYQDAEIKSQKNQIPRQDIEPARPMYWMHKDMEKGPEIGDLNMEGEKSKNVELMKILLDKQKRIRILCSAKKTTPDGSSLGPTWKRDYKAKEGEYRVVTGEEEYSKPSQSIGHGKTTDVDAPASEDLSSKITSRVSFNTFTAPDPDLSWKNVAPPKPYNKISSPSYCFAHLGDSSYKPQLTVKPSGNTARTVTDRYSLPQTLPQSYTSIRHPAIQRSPIPPTVGNEPVRDHIGKEAYATFAAFERDILPGERADENPVSLGYVNSLHERDGRVNDKTGDSMPNTSSVWGAFPEGLAKNPAEAIEPVMEPSRVFYKTVSGEYGSVVSSSRRTTLKDEQKPENVKKDNMKTPLKLEAMSADEEERSRQRVKSYLQRQADSLKRNMESTIAIRTTPSGLPTIERPTNHPKLKSENQHTLKSPEAYTKPFCDFLTENPTVFHAVSYFEEKLEKAGFKKLSERKTWNDELVAGGKYYVSRNGSSLIAFVVGPKYKAGNGIAMVAGHVDALTAKLKPVSTKPTTAGYVQLGVAPYAGALNSTWWDRDLGIGGRVLVKDAKTGKIVTRLVKLGWPIARIPTLAPHFGIGMLGQENKETQVVPIIGLDNDSTSSVTSDFKNLTIGSAGSFAATQPPKLIRAIAGELSITDVSTIVNWELELYDTQPAQTGGLEKEFIFGGRIDDKICSWAAIEALLATSSSPSPDTSIIQLAAVFDDEEIGSLLRQGARGNFLPSTIERIVETFAPSPSSSTSNILSQTYASSFLVSADVTHAINPNFTSSYLESHAPRLNTGLCIAADSNGHMTTDAISTALLTRCAELNGDKLQLFMIRNDSRSGGTIGPSLSSMMGVRAVDAGIPQLSMHSIRATVGSLDPGLGVKAFKGFFERFEEVDGEFE